MKFIKYTGLAVMMLFTIVVFLITILHFCKASLITHTLVKGNRQIVFIEMVHVASEGFFDRVRQKIKEKGDDGFIYYYEQISGGTQEEKSKLSRLMGFAEKAGVYQGMQRVLADAADLVIQPQASFSGLTKKPEVNADLTIPEILELAKDVVPEKNKDVMDFETFTKETKDLGLLDKDTLAHSLGKFVIRSILKLRVFAVNVNFKSPLDDIMYHRDLYLNKKVMETGDNLVITYGAAHFKRFKELLGPDWIEVKAERNLVF